MLAGASASPTCPAAAAAALGGCIESPLSQDLVSSVISTAGAFAVLGLFEALGRRNILDQKLSRKLVHIVMGLEFMLYWPLFSTAWHAPFFAALPAALNILRMLVLGLGIMRDEGVIKSMTRNGDHRELLKGPLYYVCTITVASVVFWRRSPIAVAAICNLCAGDGVADIVGRRFGTVKLPHNRDKSYAGSIGFLLAGFIASLLYMFYFHTFGYMEVSWPMVLGFFLVSLASAIVESLPISTAVDDNLTVPLASLSLGGLFFYLLGIKNLCYMCSSCMLSPNNLDELVSAAV